MKIHYRIQNNYIEIIRCYGLDSRVVLPGEIDGYPVRKVAAYTFSARKDKEEEDVLIYEVDGALFSEQEHLLAGTDIREVVFPDTVEEIGNYIFYGCKELHRLEFSDTLMSIGGGAFTGCGRLSELRVRMNHGEKSCVKEILGELWQRIDVTFHYNATGEVVKVVFPEHYEEAVENTPARILFTQHHGTGNNYRQCFYNKEVAYWKYDEIFPTAKIHEGLEVLTDIIFDRLICARDLNESHRNTYEEYLREHLTEIARILAGKGHIDRIKFLTEGRFWTEEALDAATEEAQAKENGELSSLLMDVRYELFPKKKRKRFEL